MPRMSASAAEGDLATVRRELSYALRSSAALVVPAATVFAVLAPWVMGSVFEYGRTTAADIEVMAGMLIAFAPGLIAFSAQYVLSRGFYALSDTRTPFFLNLVIAGLNAGLSAAAYFLLSPRWAVTGMAAASSVAFTAGAAVTAYTLARRNSAPARAPAANAARRPYGPTCGSWPPAFPRPPPDTGPPSQPTASATSQPPGREPWRSPWSSSSSPDRCA